MTIFKRRIKLNWQTRLKEALWPSQGLGRTFHYYKHRITRLPGTTHSISAGIAAGVAMSFMPLGIHVPLSIGLAFLVRGSPVAAVLATVLIGNPFVSGLAMAADIGLGEMLIGHQRAAQVGADISILDALRHPMIMLEKYGLPFMVGATVLATLSGIASYFAANRMVALAHAARARRLRRRHRRKVAHG
jgi:uncharacterized protein